MSFVGENEQQLAEFLQYFRQQLHQQPELSNQEYQTTALIHEQLTNANIRVLPFDLATGLVAEIGVSDAGKIIVLRGDIDALPIREEAEISYCSQIPGIMHACGHDFHTSVMLGVALSLKAQEKMLNGRVRIIFQPAEEKGDGAPALIEKGVLKDADVIFGIHNDPTLPLATIASRAGALTAAVDRFAVTITGYGGHAALPSASKDPLVVATQLVNAAQTIISRNVPGCEDAVVSFTHLQAGSTWNVIPDQAYLEGTIRCFNPEIRKLIEERFRAIVQGMAQSFDIMIELDWQPGPPPVINDAKWVDFAFAIAQQQGLATQYLERPLTIGEDYAFYQQQLPGAFLLIGAAASEYGLHHPKFQINDQALMPCVKFFCALSKSYLTEKQPVVIE